MLTTSYDVRLDVVVTGRHDRQSVSPYGEVSKSTRHDTTAHSRSCQSVIRVCQSHHAGLQLTDSALTGRQTLTSIHRPAVTAAAAAALLPIDRCSTVHDLLHMHNASPQLTRCLSCSYPSVWYLALD